MHHAILTIKSLSNGKFGSIFKPVLFALLLWAASAAGEIPVPGTPVPITLQTFVIMLAALMLPWRQAGAAIALYLAAGALGLPVFAGGASTLALVGPSAGFLLGFLPAAVITSLLKGEVRTDSAKGGMLTAARYCGVALVGCVAVDYLFGFIIQSAVTSVSLPVVAVASMGFAFGDVIKAVVASAVAAGLAKLR